MIQAFLVDVARLSLWLTLLSAIFIPLERLCAVERPPGRRPQLGVDLLYFYLNSLLLAAALHVPMALFLALAQRVVPAAVPATVAALPVAAQFLLALLVSELGAYWAHRLFHQVPALWRFHAIHHSPTQLDYLVNTRAHPVDLLVTRSAGLAPLCLLGLAGPRPDGVALPAAVIVFGTLWSFFIHANLKWRFGPLEWLVSTPHFHHWHHNRHENLHCNYAPMLPAVDALFGTLHLPRQWPAAYGTDTPVPETAAAQLLAPLMPVARGDAAD